MKKNLEIRIHGRGGQGSVTAAELLAVAAFYDGKFSQAFPNFGVERRGAPVEAYVRIADEKIRLREQIYNPDYLIVQDSGLIKVAPQVKKGLKKVKGILINSQKSKAELWPGIRCKNFYTVPATQIAVEIIGKPFINTAVLGAFTAMSQVVSIKSLERAIKEKFVGKGEKIQITNVQAMKKAYQYIKDNYNLEKE
ncbi:MAG TPA: pyruvate ferredoxin oxidoreductase subunit gamma [Patescibacteria group bacterium]|nr:pyruvate ferredoxin oxidoreductase subunit gamma [Patescibacteria group bacterium]